MNKKIVLIAGILLCVTAAGKAEGFTDSLDVDVFTPAVYYQSSMEDTVNTEDELWAGLSLSYSF